MIGDLGERSGRVFSPDDDSLAVVVRSEQDMITTTRKDRPTFELPGSGSLVEITEPLPDAPSVLEITATIRRGSFRIRLGGIRTGPGYIFTVPAPLGDDDGPGIIRVVRSIEGMTVLVDGRPMTPGPTRIKGPLGITIETGPGIDADIDRITLEPPTEVERKVIEAWRSGLDESTSVD